MATPASTIVLSINTSWNIVNFRSDLVRRLQDRGFAVVAVSPADGYEKALTAMGVRHVPIAINSKGLSPADDLRLLRDYWRILRELRPAAFLGWTIKPNVYGSLAAHALRIPTINNISGLGTAFIRVGPITHLVRALYRAALSRSSTVFFQNGYDRDLFVRERLVRGERCVLLPGSGIDLTRFAPVPAGEGAADDPFTFLMVARLLRDKGVVEFADAARMVGGRRPGTRFRLLGSLDAQNRTALPRSVVEDWQREGVLEYLGETDDVRPVVAAADAVVLASYREGMPRSLLEAAAMGKPLVATDVPGCTEIARVGENAVLCAPRDAGALADAMLAMLDLGADERARMGRRSRAIAQAEFDTAVVEQRYLDAIARAIAPAAAIVARNPLR